MTLPNVALSLRQPWAHAVIHGGKRIENRLKWKNSHFRGEVLIHAAKGMTMAEYTEAVCFAAERGLAGQWARPPIQALDRGGIVGVARVVGVVMPPNYGGPLAGRAYVLAPGGAGDYAAHVEREMTARERQWWMGGFALVLDDVRALPFTPCKGALGFFKVADDVVRRLSP